MSSTRSRLILIAVLVLLSFYVFAPTAIYLSQPPEVRNDHEIMKSKVPGWLPKTRMNLGLDLQGGVQLVLGVNLDQAVENKLGLIGSDVIQWAQENKIAVKTAYAVKGAAALRVELNDDADVSKFQESFREKFPTLAIAAQNNKNFDYKFKEDQIKSIKDSALVQAERVIRSRVDKWGVTEPLINRRADGSVLVQLPGFKDPDKAKELLGRTAQLKFKIVDDSFSAFQTLASQLPPEVQLKNVDGQPALVSTNKAAIQALVKDLVPADHELLFQEEKLAGQASRYTTYVVLAATELSGADVLDAVVTYSSQGLDNRPAVSLRFSDAGARRFESITGANVGKRMAIVLDENVESAPVIQTKISGGNAQITLGSGRGFQQQIDEANQLALVLKSGALPAAIDILEQRQVGASLGPELATEGALGTAVGIGLVFAFMILYYRRPGTIACAALVLNGIFVAALMAAFGFSLSLPGIAAFVLGLGMAVDANVLINERIRQELREGKTPKKALDLGFKKVFWTVCDSHVTTILASTILLQTNTSGPIRGFAITLIIGLIVSLFTSLYCSRMFFDIVMAQSSALDHNLKWLGGERAKVDHHFHFNFLRFDLGATILSALFVVAVLITGATKGFNWSVDFVGGMEVEMAFNENIDVHNLRSIFEKAGIKDLTVQALKGGEKEFLVRFDKEGLESIEKALGDASHQEQNLEGGKASVLQEWISKELKDKQPKINRVDYVGPQIGKELRNDGIKSLFYAILGILVYLSFRFDMRFGSGAVLKMIPDISIMLAFYLFFWRAFDLTTIAALLTGIGYSVNDVIVVFDRIRENITNHPARPFRDNINISLNETLSRTINTSLVTSLSLVGILIFGSGSIWNFSAAMFLGILGATLTSNFVGSSYLMWFDQIKTKFVTTAKPKTAAAVKA